MDSAGKHDPRECRRVAGHGHHHAPGSMEAGVRCSAFVDRDASLRRGAGSAGLFCHQPADVIIHELVFERNGSLRFG